MEPDMATDLVAALAAMPDITKSNTANTGTYSYSYADLGAIMATVRPILAEHHLAIMQDVEPADRGVSVTTVLQHSSGQAVRYGRVFIGTGHGGAQDVGSAITYARRYSLMTTLGLATEDDDGARAHQAQREATEPHPLDGRVRAALADMKRLTDTGKDQLRLWADGRKLSGSALLADEDWLLLVESWLDENGGQA